MTRILDIAQSYPSENKNDFGGIFILRQFHALRERGYDIRVVSPQAFFYREFKGVGKDYPIRSSKGEIETWRPRYLWFPRIFNSSGRVLETLYWNSIKTTLPQILSHWNPHVIIADWIVPGGFAAKKISEKLGVPMILRARGHDVKIILDAAQRGGALARYYGKILDHSSRILCQGAGLFSELLETRLLDESKAEVLTNGVDVSSFCPAIESQKSALRFKLGLPQNKQILVFVGRWETAKGTRELTHALVRLMKHSTNTYFLSLGPCRDYDSRNTLLAKFEHRVRFEGSVEPGRLPNYLRASDVFVLPSYREGLPNAMIEAMACGIPVVVTPVGGIPSLISDGHNGFLVESKNSNRLYEILSNPTLYTEAHEIGKRAIETLYEEGLVLPTVVDRLDQLLAGLAASVPTGSVSR